MRSLVTLNTIALELVPPNVERSPERALEEARKVLQFAGESGIEGRIGHVMIPGMIAEDDDRPVEMKPKLDVLEFWSIIKPELPGVNGLCTQVTAFMDEPSLRQRLTDLGDICSFWYLCGTSMDLVADNFAASTVALQVSHPSLGAGCHGAACAAQLSLVHALTLTSLDPIAQCDI